MFPKRCVTCRTVYYTEKLKESPPPCSCGSSKFQVLTKICCFIPLTKGGNKLHVSGAVPDGFPPDVSTVDGVEWQTACNAKSLPTNVTNQPLACTCYDCVEYLKQHNLMTPEPIQNEEIDPGTVITFESDEPPNPFKANS